LLELARRNRLPDGVWSLVHRRRNPGDLARHVAAAAFSGGATFMLAMARKPGHAGLLEVQPYELLLAACLRLIFPRPDVEAYIEQDERGSAFVLEVAGSEPGTPPPRVEGSFPLGGVFELRNGRPRPVDPGKLEELDRRAGITPDELAQARSSDLGDLDREALDRIGDGVRAPAGQDALVVLHELGILTHPSSRGVPTLAAMAAMGDPRHEVRGLPRIELRSHPFGLAEAASGLRQRGTPLVLTGGLFAIEPELRTALRPFTRGRPLTYQVVLEAIVNAVGHRSYTPDHLREPINIELYIDAVLVRSPGAPLERVGMVDEDGPQRRFARNPRLMNLLRLLGLAESRGFGRGLLLRGGDTGLEPARFEADGDWLGVALELQQPKVPKVRREPADGGVEQHDAADESDDEPGASPAKGVADDRRARVLAVIEKLGTASARELAEELDVSRSTIGNWLRGLIDAGEVCPVGGGATSPHRRYEVAGRG
jgi:hypothetical protein